MKVESFHVHNVSTRQLGKEVFGITYKQSMETKSFNVINVNSKHLRNINC